MAFPVMYDIMLKQQYIWPAASLAHMGRSN